MSHSASNIHANSIAAYHASGPMISRRAQMVLEWIRANGRATDRQVMQGLGFGEPGAVRPRITELIGIGALIEVGNAKCEITGKAVRIVDIPRPSQGALFQ